MRKTKRGITVAILCLSLLAAISFAMVGCGGEKLKITRFELAETVKASIGKEFTLPAAVVEDSNGNRIFPTIAVTDPSGDAVNVENNKIFIAEIGTYEAVYTALYGEGLSESKTLKIEAEDNGVPDISVEGNRYAIFALIGKVTLPKITVTDDSGIRIVPTVAVKRGETAYDYSAEDNSFVADAAGRYDVTVTATDSAGNSDSKTIVVNVAYENDVVIYSGYDGGYGMLKESETLHYSSSHEHVFGGESASTKVESMEEWNDIWFDVPAISDLSGYTAMYAYLYNDSAFDIEISTNSVYNPSVIRSGSWGLFQIYQEDNKWFKSDGKVAFAADDTAEENAADPIKNPATPDNIGNFRLVVHGKAGNELKLYLSNVRVTDAGRAPEIKEVTLPIGAKNAEYTVPEPEFIVHSKGEAELVGVTVRKLDGSDEVLKNDGGYKFTPDAEGSFSVTYQYKDALNKINAFTTKEIIVSDLTGIENEIVNFGKDYALKQVKGNGETTLSLNENSAYLFGDEARSLKVASSNWFTDVTVIAPSVVDLTGKYSVCYFAYNASEIPLLAAVNGKSGAAVKVVLQPGRWTQVEYQSNIWQDNVFTTGDVRYPASQSNIAGYTIHFINETYESEGARPVTVYMSAPVARTEAGPVITNNVGAGAIVESEVDLAGFTAQDSASGAGCNLEFAVSDPEGNPVVVTGNKFLLELTGQYVVTVIAKDAKGLVTIRDFTLESLSKEVKDVALMTPVENMDLTASFADYDDERIRILTDAPYGSESTYLSVNARADECWIDFKVKFTPVDLAKFDRISFAFKRASANAVNSQLWLKGVNGDNLLLSKENMVNGKWMEITIHGKDFNTYFGSDLSAVSELRFMINPANASDYMSQYYEFHFSSIHAFKDTALFAMSSGTDKAGFSFASEESFDLSEEHRFGRDERGLRVNMKDEVVWDGRINFGVNFTATDLTRANSVYFYVLRTAPNAVFSSVKVKGANGTQVQIVESLDLGNWTRVTIDKTQFAEVFGNDLTAVSQLTVEIDPRASDGNAYMYYQYFMSSVYMN